MSFSQRICLLLSAVCLCLTQSFFAQTADPSPATHVVTISAGVPLHVVLDQRVSYTQEGREVRGHLAQPVFVFDQVAIPAGAEVRGKVVKVHAVPKMKQFNAALGGDFTPLREAEVEFDALVLSDGRQVAIRSAGASRDSVVVKMGSSTAQQGSLWAKLKDKARTTFESEKHSAEAMIHEQHKLEHLKNSMLAKLPYHPQVYEKGTQFVADLQAPVEVEAPAAVSHKLDEIGSRPLPDSILHARLTNGLSSASAKVGDKVEAVLTEPVYSGDHLILPEGTRLTGSVLRVTPAKRFGHNGDLRFTFTRMQLPSGTPLTIKGDLAAAETGKDGNVKIDEEGVAQATQPKGKYLLPLATVLLAQSTSESDGDGVNGNGGAAAGGFGWMGRLLALSTTSHYIAYGIGYYGAGRSIYSRFIATGHDVVFPRDTQIDIRVGKR